MTALILRKPDLGISLTEDAHALKDDALESAALIGKVTNASEQEIAVAAAGKIKSALDLIEKARKAAKEPFLEAGKRVDDACKTFRVELENEWGRLTHDLIDEFQRQERRRIDEEKRKQEAELKRIEDERQNEIRRIAQAEAAERAKLDAQEKAAKDETERARILSEKAALEAVTHQKMADVTDSASMQAAIASEPILATKARGQIVKEDWEITITNPYELAKFHPDCVKIEALLLPIKTLLNQGVTVKGVTAKKVTKTSVRTTTQKLIEI